MRSTVLAISFAVVGSLAGCATPEENRYYESQRQAEAQQASERRAQEAERKIQAARTSCERFGFNPGTDTFAQCVRAEYQKSVSSEQQQAAIAACQSAMFLRPTRSGQFSESYFNAAKCTADPQAHLKQDRENVTCTRNPNGSVTCRPSL